MSTPESNAKKIVLNLLSGMDFIEFENSANEDKSLSGLTEREMHQAYLAWLDIKDEWENA